MSGTSRGVCIDVRGTEGVKQDMPNVIEAPWVTLSPCHMRECEGHSLMPVGCTLLLCSIKKHFCYF